MCEDLRGRWSWSCDERNRKRNASANESSASPIVIYELYHSFSQFFPVPHSCHTSQSVHCTLSECTLYKSLAHKQTYIHSSDTCSFWPPWTLPEIICHRTNNNFHIQHHVVDHNSTLSRVVAKTCFVLYLLCTNSTIKGISLGCPIWVYSHKVPVLMLKRNSWYAPALWLCWDFFGTVTHLPNKDKRLYSVGQPRHRDSLDFLFIAASDKRSYGFKRKKFFYCVLD